MEYEIKERVLPTGAVMHICKRCGQKYLSYMSAPGICDSKLCYEKGLERNRR